MSGPCIFLSTPSARRATRHLRVLQAQDQTISIHALREEGDRYDFEHQTRWSNFYPRPPRGGRQVSSTSRSMTCLFLSTPSARRATRTTAFRTTTTPNFYPRPPRGGRRHRRSPSVRQRNFYPRPPRGGRRQARSGHQVAQDISIHALREEGDKPSQVGGTEVILFLSTPSARRATAIIRRGSLPLLHFYPRPPRGGRHKHALVIKLLKIFLSTPSARRATLAGPQAGQGRRISIHALREEGDKAVAPTMRRR